MMLGFRLIYGSGGLNRMGEPAVLKIAEVMSCLLRMPSGLAD